MPRRPAVAGVRAPLFRVLRNGDAIDENQAFRLSISPYKLKTSVNSSTDVDDLLNVLFCQIGSLGDGPRGGLHFWQLSR
jgi:hypothetical protein